MTANRTPRAHAVLRGAPLCGQCSIGALDGTRPACCWCCGRVEAIVRVLIQAAKGADVRARAARLCASLKLGLGEAEHEPR
jgi:hypothetical protein